MSGAPVGGGAPKVARAAGDFSDEQARRITERLEHGARRLQELRELAADLDGAFLTRIADLAAELAAIRELAKSAGIDP